MSLRASFLLLAALAACSAEAPGPPPAAETLAVVRLEADEDARPEARLAREMRGFFFAQARLYQSGAAADAGSSLAPILQAMGRDDLVMRAPGDSGEVACPQRWVDPVELISKAASGARALILETDRSAPEQLAFVQDIAARLATDGFTAYADDGLAFDPGHAQGTDAPLITEGLAMRDPMHGRVVREAKQRGLQLVDAGVWWSGPAELAALSNSERLTRRHAALAEQAARVFWRTPDVHAILHAEQGEESGTLAREFQQLTGYRPVTVAFVQCTETSDPPAFLPLHYERADIVIALPRPELTNGRLMSGADARVPVPSAFLASGESVLVEARRVGDPVLAVPEDRLMLLPGDRLPLRLPPGSYRIEAWTEEGPVDAPVSMTVS